MKPTFLTCCIGLLLASPASAATTPEPSSTVRVIHVALDGKDDNPGTRSAPLRTIQRGAELAQPGDTVTVHAGIYRERVNPSRGGQSDTQRIVFQAAPGEKVEIRGSEPVSAWERMDGPGNVWKTVVPNAFFNGFNPYAHEIKGHWFETKGRKHHTGAVYIDGEWLIEAASLEDLFKEPEASAKPVGGYLFNLAWFAIGAGTEAKRIPAATHSASAGVQPAKLAAGTGVDGDGLGWIEEGDWARYDNLPLDGATSLSVQVSSASSGGTLEARADSPGGKLLGRIQVKPTGDWGKWATLEMPLKPVVGAQSLCLRFRRTPVPGAVDLHWFAQVEKENTTIWAQFGDSSPPAHLVEINVRQTVFYPDKPGRNFITVRGFALRHAATPWAPPTFEQIGLIGPHWSKGWIIENNDISHSICAGISLGKYNDAGDAASEATAEGYVDAINRAIVYGWDGKVVGHHMVRGNKISHCEQAGIVGSLGAVFSTVANNVIHDIHIRQLFGGLEQAGIKIHGSIDMEIVGNVIRRCNGFGMWLDWMTQGTRVSRNILLENGNDLFMEVNHGPFVVDNNVFLSPGCSILSISRGGAYLHNWIGGSIDMHEFNPRKTPFHEPHSTRIAGFHDNPGGDDRFINNIFSGPRADMSVYDKARLPVVVEDNLYLKGAKPGRHDVRARVAADFDPALLLLEKAGRVSVKYVLPSTVEGGLRGRRVDSARLGSTAISQQPFSNQDGSPLSIDIDFLGRPRNSDKPLLGPLEDETTAQTLK